LLFIFPFCNAIFLPLFYTQMFSQWKTPGSNSIICHQQAIIYSIALLDICDFEAIGCKMPKGTGVDASISDGTVAPKQKVRQQFNMARIKMRIKSPKRKHLHQQLQLVVLGRQKCLCCVCSMNLE
jgi:hypothetical protein